MTGQGMYTLVQSVGAVEVGWGRVTVYVQNSDDETRGFEIKRV